MTNAALSRQSPYSNIPIPDTSDKRDGFFTRFIRLKIANDGSIECRLHVAELSEIGEFEALSYTWGPPLPTKNILLNGKAFAIRMNLWQALDAILKDRKERRMKVGAVSIHVY